MLSSTQYEVVLTPARAVKSASIFKSVQASLRISALYLAAILFASLTGPAGSSAFAGLAIAPDPGSLPVAEQGVNYSVVFTVAGASTSFDSFTANVTAAGTTGLVNSNFSADLAAGTLKLTNNTLNAGTATFSLSYADAGGVNSNTVNYTLTVVPPPTLPAQTTIPGAIVGVPYSTGILVIDGIAPFTASGTLSDNGTGINNFTLTGRTVTVTGSPSTAGTAMLNLTVKDANGLMATANYNFAVFNFAPPPTTIPAAVVGQVYNQSIVVTGGSTPYTTTLLPAYDDGSTGLPMPTVTSATGTVAFNGAPTAAGVATFTMNVKDNNGATVTQAYSISVLNFSPAPNAVTGAVVGTTYTQSIGITGGTPGYQTVINPMFDPGATGLGPPTVSAGMDGVSFNSAPTAAGLATYTIQVTDALGHTGSQPYTVSAFAFDPTPATIPMGHPNVPYSTVITITGGTTLPYSSLSVAGFNAGSTGLTTPTADSAAGTVTFSSTPTMAGTATFTINVKDSSGATVAVPYSVIVGNQVPSFVKGPDIGTPTNGFTALAQTFNGWATQISPSSSFPADPNETSQTVNFIVSVNTVGNGTDNANLFNVAPAVSPTGALTFTINPNQFGVATVSVMIHDNAGGTDTSAAQTFVISILNTAPSFTKGPDIGTPANGFTTLAQTFPGWATNLFVAPTATTPVNETAQTLSFNVTVNAVGNGTDNANLFAVAPAISAVGDLNFTLNSCQFGVATVSVQIQDTGGNADGGANTSAVQTFTITVKNLVPAFTKGPDIGTPANGFTAQAQTFPNWATNLQVGPTAATPANEGCQSLSFLVSAADPTLFSVQPAIDAGGTLTFTLNSCHFGATTVNVQIHDNGGTADGGVDTSAIQTFTISVKNLVPSFVANNVVSTEDASAQNATSQKPTDLPTAQTLVFATQLSQGPTAAVPANEPCQALNFILVSNSNPSIFSVQPVLNNNGTVTFTPAHDFNGVSTLVVRIHDNGGTAGGGVDTSATQSFTITINAVNDTPQVDPAVDASVNPAPKPLAFVNTPPNQRPNTAQNPDVNGGMIPDNIVLTNYPVDLTVTAYDVDLDPTKNQQALGPKLTFDWAVIPSAGVAFTKNAQVDADPYSTDTGTYTFSIAGHYAVTVTIGDGVTSVTSSLEFDVNAPAVLGSVQLPANQGSTLPVGQDVIFNAYADAGQTPIAIPPGETLTYIWSYKRTDESDDNYRIITTVPPPTSTLVLNTSNNQTFQPDFKGSDTVDVLIQCVIRGSIPQNAAADSYTSTPPGTALPNYPLNYRSLESTRTVLVTLTNPTNSVRTALSTVVRNPINHVTLFNLGGRGLFQIDARYVTDGIPVVKGGAGVGTSQLLLDANGNPTVGFPLTLSLVDPTSIDLTLANPNINLKADPTTKAISKATLSVDPATQVSTATLTTTFPHNFLKGQLIQINLDKTVTNYAVYNNGAVPVTVVDPVTATTFSYNPVDPTHSSNAEEVASGLAILTTVNDIETILNKPYVLGGYPEVNSATQLLDFTIINPKMTWLPAARVANNTATSDPANFTMVTHLNSPIPNSPPDPRAEGVSLVVLQNMNDSDPKPVARRMIPITTNESITGEGADTQPTPGDYSNTFITGHFGFGKGNGDLVSFRGVVLPAQNGPLILTGGVTNKISVGLGNIIIEGTFKFVKNAKTATVDKTSIKIFDDGTHDGATGSGKLTAKNVAIFRVQLSDKVLLSDNTIAPGLLINLSIKADDLSARGFDTAGIVLNPKDRFGFDPPVFFHTDTKGNVGLGTGGSLTPVFIQSSVVVGQQGALNNSFDSVVRSFFYVKNGKGILVGQNFKTK